MLNVTIPIELSMTIDGVGGLDPGDVFLVDYLPKIYRKYAYFQIFTINHSISTSGWDTKLTAKMKLNTKKMIKDGLIVLIEPDPPSKPNILQDLLVLLQVVTASSLAFLESQGC